jgi:hypothetical protein
MHIKYKYLLKAEILRLDSKHFRCFLKIFILFICAYILCGISPPSPHPLFYLPLLPSLPPLTPLYQAEIILPLSLILLKREYKQ